MTTASKTTIPPLLSVTSNAVQQVGHSNDTLFVRFKTGKLYRYPGVNADQYAALGSAKSLGKHLRESIFPKHKGELVKEAGGK